MSHHNRRGVDSFLSGPGPSGQQSVLLDASPAERVEQRWPFVHSLKALVEEVLGTKLRELGSREGGYSYDPCSLFLVFMFGLMRGVRSSRALEECCQCDYRFVFLSDGLEPDHATLARFRRKMGPHLEEMFALACAHAEERGILERRSMVVDGTKVAAVRSQWRRALSESEEADVVEEEAHQMKGRSGFLIGYNIQISADCKSRLITGYVASNNPSDQIQMEPLMQATKRQSGGAAERVVADKGYDSSVNAEALSTRGVKAFLPASRPERLPFYADEKGGVRCPSGHLATKVSAKMSKQVYRVFQCEDCKLKRACGVTGSRRDHTAPVGLAITSRLEANARCLTEEGRKLLKARGPTIEPIFGHFKWNLKFHRLILRGLEGATLELGMIALSNNLRRMVRA